MGGREFQNQVALSTEGRLVGGDSAGICSGAHMACQCHRLWFYSISHNTGLKILVQEKESRTSSCAESGETLNK